jgi:hypothetical protein
MPKEKKYFISDDIFHDSILKFTSNIMRHQKGWKKDENLSSLEFQIEGIIKNHLDGYGGIALPE